ncbi:MAG: hypothetical protein GF333_04275 [Candidatus Omnitrophica bacterium]|nr:hypothetical protein [Candidatus Omnitrophota bacterium]
MARGTPERRFAGAAREEAFETGFFRGRPDFVFLGVDGERPEARLRREDDVEDTRRADPDFGEDFREDFLTPPEREEVLRPDRGVRAERRERGVVLRRRGRPAGRRDPAGVNSDLKNSISPIARKWSNEQNATSLSYHARRNYQPSRALEISLAKPINYDIVG